MDFEEISSNIWGKSSSKDDGLWLPLYVHHQDTQYIINKLWDEWISNSTKTVICNSMNLSPNFAVKVICFIAAVHDVGKCTPAFQARTVHNNKTFQNQQHLRLNQCKLPFRSDLSNPDKINHATASQWILEKYGIDRSLALIAGGHHGKPPGRSFRDVEAYPDNIGINSEIWIQLQKWHVEAQLHTSDISSEFIKSIYIGPPGQSLITGLLIMADWIASNVDSFPLGSKSHYTKQELTTRGETGWKKLHLPEKWPNHNVPIVSEIFESRFGFDPRTFQSSAAEVAQNMDALGLIIVEAPMGEGKTEAALAMAEILAKKNGLSGLFFALPTQATSDGIFPRVVKWLEKVSLNEGSSKTIFLSHGRAEFNKTYAEIPLSSNCSSEDRLIIHEWFYGKKKRILSDIVVGTIDQILMAGLKRKHLPMRHLGLSNKVVVIDEVHAYDAYMGNYLEKCLMWLSSFNVPVILLSATLPIARRKKLVDAYMNGRGLNAKGETWETDIRYPLITFTQHDFVKSLNPQSSGRSFNIDIRRMSDANFEEIIKSCSKNGGYVGIIVNTVQRAQHICSFLKNIYGSESTDLLHSRFTGLDRATNESRVLRLLNDDRKSPPHKHFVIGTQVIEQSLDLDFDILLTDICPMDLLLQRIGRLHRHNNVRPKGLETPICYVMCDGDARCGANAVYGKYPIFNTDVLLPKSINIPHDIPILIQKAYSEKINVSESMKNEYEKAYEEQNKIVSDKETKAKQFQIWAPCSRPNLMLWLEDDLQGNDEIEAKAVVRDIDASLEVILLKRNCKGNLETVSKQEKVEFNEDSIEGDIAYSIMGNRVSLPYAMVSGARINEVVDELKLNLSQLPQKLRNTSWTEGELFMILDTKNETDLGHKHVRYDDELGLVVDKC